MIPYIINDVVLFRVCKMCVSYVKDVVNECDGGYRGDMGNRFS